MLSQRLARLARGLRQNLAAAEQTNLPLAYPPSVVLEIVQELQRCSSLARGLEQFPAKPLPPGTPAHDVHPGSERLQ